MAGFWVVMMPILLGLGVFAIIILAVMFLFFLTGAILLTISLILRSNAKKAGQKPKKAMLITGISFLSVPVVAILATVVAVSVGVIGKEIETTNYANFTDKWKNEWVSDNVAAYEAGRFIELNAKEKNADKIATMFTDEIRKDGKLMTEISAFLEEYPEVLTADKIYFLVSASGSGTDNHFYASGEANIDGEMYYVYISGYNQNYNYPEKVGVESLAIYSAANMALVNDGTLKTPHKYIGAYTKSRTSKSVHIDYYGHPVLYTEYDRALTKEQVKNAVMSCKYVNELSEVLGEPNAINEEEGELLYIITPEDGYKYCLVSFTKTYKEVYKCYFYGDYKSGIKKEHYKKES